MTEETCFSTPSLGMVEGGAGGGGGAGESPKTSKVKQTSELSVRLQINP